MKNWTDSCINWNQLPGTEVKRLIATWGFTPEQIAKYDKKHGFLTAPAKPVTPQVPALKGMTPLGIKPTAKAAPAKKTVAVKAPVRQKHVGADGEIKFVEHRNLYVGFYGGKVVVTKRTAEACKEFLQATYSVAE
jgi:hypothetical protein